MLVLNPREVTFDGETWGNVSLVAIDRKAETSVVEFGDLGPHAVFADVPARRVEIRVERDVVRDDLGGPLPGQIGELAFFTAPTASNAGRKRVTSQAVVLGVRHELSTKKGAIRRIDLVAVSPDGAQDPVSIQDAEL